MLLTDLRGDAMEVRRRLPSFLTLFFCNVSAPEQGVEPDERSRIAVAIYRSAAFHRRDPCIIKTPGLLRSATMMLPL